MYEQSRFPCGVDHNYFMIKLCCTKFHSYCRNQLLVSESLRSENYVWNGSLTGRYGIQERSVPLLLTCSDVNVVSKASETHTSFG